MSLKSIAISVGAAVLAAQPVSATIVGGSVPSGSGDTFSLIADPSGWTIGDDNQQQNNTLYGFDEDQNIILPSDLNLGGSVPSRTEYTFSIAAGTVVASHYIFFDPASSLERLVGTVEFDANILGVAVFTDDLLATDFLFNNSVTYMNPGNRGIEIIENHQWSANRNEDQDTISFLGDTLSVDFIAGSPGDYIRVFTEQSPAGPAPSAPQVPLPAAAWLLLAALGGLFGLRRRA